MGGTGEVVQKAGEPSEWYYTGEVVAGELGWCGGKRAGELGW